MGGQLLSQVGLPGTGAQTVEPDHIDSNPHLGTSSLCDLRLVT